MRNGIAPPLPPWRALFFLCSCTAHAHALCSAPQPEFCPGPGAGVQRAHQDGWSGRLHLGGRPGERRVAPPPQRIAACFPLRSPLWPICTREVHENKEAGGRASVYWMKIALGARCAGGAAIYFFLPLPARSLSLASLSFFCSSRCLRLNSTSSLSKEKGRGGGKRGGGRRHAALRARGGRKTPSHRLRWGAGGVAARAGEARQSPGSEGGEERREKGDKDTRARRSEGAQRNRIDRSGMSVALWASKEGGETKETHTHTHSHTQRIHTHTHNAYTHAHTHAHTE